MMKESELRTLLGKARLSALKRDSGDLWKARLATAIRERPGQPGRVALRLLQLCGIVPSEADVARLNPPAEPPAA